MLSSYFYNQTLKKAVAVFGTLFNNMKTKRPGKSEVRVPIAYGPREKFLARITADTVAATDNTIAIKLPRMSFEITSIEFDSTSKLNKFNKRVFTQTTTDEIDNTEIKSTKVVNQSVPYNISMQLNIFAKTQDDALQIFEQILPTFTPEYTVAVKDMEGPGSITDVPIVLNGTSFTDDYEGDFETRRTLVYTLDFTMKVRFAGGVSDGKIIRTIDTFFYTDTKDKHILKQNAPYGDENVRIAVDSTDEPPLDDTDTVTTTFGFDHD